MDWVLERFKLRRAIRNGHFVLKSGRHADTYVDKNLIFLRPSDVSDMACAIAVRCYALAPNVVIGPAMAGAFLAQWVAFHLAYLLGREVLALYAEKEGSGFALKRGQDTCVQGGKRILVVEDVLTTGGSVRGVVDLVRALGGEVIGVEALVNRGGVKSQDVGGVASLRSLVELLTLTDWSRADCPLCKGAMPVNTDVGHGKEFIAAGSH